MPEMYIRINEHYLATIHRPLDLALFLIEQPEQPDKNFGRIEYASADCSKEFRDDIELILIARRKRHR